VPRCPRHRVALEPLPRNGLQRVLGGQRATKLFRSTLCTWVAVRGEMSAFLVASIARFLEADFGVDTEREQLLFAVDPVAETPVLLPVLVDPEIKASGVGHFANT